VNNSQLDTTVNAAHDVSLASGVAKCVCVWGEGVAARSEFAPALRHNYLGGGGLLQVNTSTANRYSLHWIDWVSQRRTRATRNPAKGTADNTSLNKTQLCGGGLGWREPIV
jgi:hypothetical protein